MIQDLVIRIVSGDLSLDRAFNHVVMPPAFSVSARMMSSPC